MGNLGQDLTPYLALLAASLRCGSCLLILYEQVDLILALSGSGGQNTKGEGSQPGGRRQRNSKDQMCLQRTGLGSQMCCLGTQQMI